MFFFVNFCSGTYSRVGVEDVFVVKYTDFTYLCFSRSSFQVYNRVFGQIHTNCGNLHLNAFDLLEHAHFRISNISKCHSDITYLNLTVYFNRAYLYLIKCICLFVIEVFR